MRQDLCDGLPYGVGHDRVTGTHTGEGMPGAFVAANQFIVVVGLPVKTFEPGSKPIHSTICLFPYFTR